VTQAALPIMRAQGLGHIIQVTSEGGVIAYPGIEAYHASKWAVEGLSQSLAQEVATLGVWVTLVEPGPYDTDWLAVGARQSQKNSAYDSVREQMSRSWAGVELGHPSATRSAILAVVDAEKPPLRIFFGKAQWKA
jgi:short-subunit dehydrogenase